MFDMDEGSSDFAPVTVSLPWNKGRPNNPSDNLV